MILCRDVTEGVPSAVDDVAPTVELVVVELDPMDVTSMVLSGIPVVEPTDDVEVVEVLV